MTEIGKNRETLSYITETLKLLTPGWVTYTPGDVILVPDSPIWGDGK